MGIFIDSLQPLQFRLCFFCAAHRLCIVSIFIAMLSTHSTLLQSLSRHHAARFFFSPHPTVVCVHFFTYLHCAHLFSCNYIVDELKRDDRSFDALPCYDKQSLQEKITNNYNNRWERCSMACRPWRNNDLVHCSFFTFLSPEFLFFTGSFFVICIDFI